MIPFTSKAVLALLLASAQVIAETPRKRALDQLALEKVLGDSAQVFGVSRAQHGPRANWMAAYPDPTRLEYLNIPGTHDSATWNFSAATRDALPPDEGVRDPAYYRCQRRSISVALGAGVRFFDLRFALDTTAQALVFWHKEALLSGRAGVEDVLFGFYAWLEAHPSETVLVSLQYEGGTVPGASFDARAQGALVEVLNSRAGRQYIHQGRDALPTLGGARGKVILLRRFDLTEVPGVDLPGLHLSPGKWLDNGLDFELVYNEAHNLSAFIEDYYEPTEDDVPSAPGVAANVVAKLNATTAHLAEAAQPRHADSLFITFSSARRLEEEPPIIPEIMALGNGSTHTPRGGVNQQLLPFLKSLKGKRLGVVVLDYFEEPESLVGTILDL